MELLEALCCPVSQEPYGPTGAVRPRVLPCGHTISHTSLQSILKQDSTGAHTCPICRTHLPNTSARTYATNFAILDILPGVLRLRNTSTTDHYATGALNSDSDSDAGDHDLSAPLSHSSASVPSGPTPATAAVAALFPRVQWLQERVDLPLRLVDVLPAARHEAGPLRMRTWALLTAKYEVPASAITVTGHGRRSSSSRQVLPDSALLTGYLQGDDSHQTLIVHFPSCDSRRAPPAADDPSALSPAQVAVAVHAALQLAPEAWRTMQPLVGFFTEAPPAAAPNAPSAGAAAAAGAAGTVGLTFVQQGVPLAEYAEQRPRGPLMLPLVEAVEVMRQLTRMLVLLHDHGLSTSATAPLCYSSVYIVPGSSPAHLSVRWAPWGAAATSSSAVQQADGLCVPPENSVVVAAEGEEAAAADVQKGDVWRAAAVALATLAANWLVDGERKPTIRELLSGLQGRVSSHLVIVLNGCLHEDPQQRWTAARAQLHLALVATQIQASSSIFDALWTLPAPWSLMLPCPPGRASAAGRSSATASSRRLAAAAESEAPCGIDVVLDGAALQAARTYEVSDPLADYVNDVSAAERHYGCIMCACLVLCLLPLCALFVVMIVFMNR
eukprot:jgi/Ulvmu1/8353/UM042_0059.1